MKNIEANKYFKNLFDLLQNTQVTDNHGKTLPMAKAVDWAVDKMQNFRKQRGKVILVGNGGSAAIVAHMHNDLCKSAGVRAMVFHETSLLTALSNDISYQEAYEWSICQWAEPGDLLIAVSSSGGSENIIRAVKAAKAKKCDVITLSGFKENNPLRGLGNINFYIPNEDYGFVEVAHMAIGHYLTDASTSEDRGA
jgi:D-sedoheptulose 7-phosphate isomerase